MLMSKLFSKTLREDPQDAEIISHKLLVRAGMIKKLASGIYTFLPLGLRVIKKIENIVREEMDKAGAQELLMPTLLPRELWEETGRWNLYGPELIRIKDRHSREFCLGPTHEEIITDLVRESVRSYRQLPIILYQIQTKFRDEIRPRFGIMRTREFIMKDAYSFERNEEELNASYNKMYETYTRIFSRCGLKFRAVEAFTGAIGGDVSHEFMVLADTGEDIMLYCEECKYSANQEKAEGEEVPNSKFQIPNSKLKDLKKVSTPNIRTVEEVCNFLNVSPQNLVKTLIYVSDGEPIAALVRGDQNLNPEKLKNVLGARLLEMADKKLIEEVTHSPVGFAGPVGLKIKIVADKQIISMRNFVTGANENGAHLINVNQERDFKIDVVGDIRFTKPGDRCIHCSKGILKESRGIEVGHIFKLGTKYSKPMQTTYFDEEGKEKTVYMGCYGIGISRIMAAAVEQSYDEDGIIWPVNIAPYSVSILPLQVKEEKEMNLAKKIYNELWEEKIDTILDDRDERAGVKFKDADLIGFPLRVVIGRTFSENKVEIKLRKSKEVIKVEVEEVKSKIQKFLEDLRKEGNQ